MLSSRFLRTFYSPLKSISLTTLRAKPVHRPLLPTPSSRLRPPRPAAYRPSTRAFHSTFRTSQRSRPQPGPDVITALVRSRATPYVVGVVAAGGASYYYAHLELVPVSGRRRFNCYTEEDAEAQGELAYRQILQQEASRGTILPDWDPRVRQVRRVLTRLINGGDLKSTTKDRGGGWDVKVIEDPGESIHRLAQRAGAPEGKSAGEPQRAVHILSRELIGENMTNADMANAFVLPGGKVFVYSGILPICGGDDGLAAVLGHEIAHNLATHACEAMSRNLLFQPLVWIADLADIYLTSGQPTGLGRWLGSLGLELGIMRPGSRAQESEADYIGLMLMAQSCYDPAAAVGLWRRMERAQKGAPPEWISTHPSNENRIARITQWLPTAEEKSRESGCAATAGYVGDFQSALSSALLGRA
ncbi:MAG: hypothetical protein M1818_006002 [Claussenomyces sp. TS43310]|nr:MAG: hypothetical protein M1818_006002 [Claussenomyces sp. TS43310]